MARRVPAMSGFETEPVNSLHDRTRHLGSLLVLRPLPLLVSWCQLLGRYGLNRGSISRARANCSEALSMRPLLR